MESDCVGFRVSDIAFHIDEYLTEVMRSHFALLELLEGEAAEVPHGACEDAAMGVEGILVKYRFEQGLVTTILRTAVQREHIMNGLPVGEIAQGFFGTARSLQRFEGEGHRKFSVIVEGLTA